MTEMSLREVIDPPPRWVAMWREAVRVSGLAMSLADAETARVIELSPRAAELLGLTPEEGAGLSSLDLAERPEAAAETLRLVREGILDGVQARRRYRRSDGTAVEIESTGRVIRSPGGPDLVLFVAHETPPEADRATAAECGPAPVPTGSDGGAAIGLDDRWRISRVTASATSVLGHEPAELVTTSIIDLTHPADRAALLLAFARATSSSPAHARLRLRDRAVGWRPRVVALTFLGLEGSSPFSVAVAGEDGDASDSGVEARARIEADLLRIAAELRSRQRGAGPRPAPDPVRFPALSRLTTREWEVLARLMDGDRVSSIAADLFVSQSTVRHHLSAIFAKVGVHSQAELIRHLRPSEHSA